MEIKKITNDLYEIIPHIHRDNRGFFIKTFNYDEFKKYGLETNFKEEYYSVSYKNVLRGMHFQLPPYDLVKLVTCISGRVLDVVVDIRKNSPNLGKVVAIELSSQKANLIYIPKGFAHGFYTLEDNSIMLYKTSAVYNSKYDSGILWNSIPFKWPCSNPIISQRDQKFQTLKEFINHKVF